MSVSQKIGKIAVAVLVCTTWIVLISAAAGTAQAQAPAPQQKTAPKSGGAGQGTTTKKTSSTARAYDRALLRPALLKDKAPEEYKVKFVTTRGEFTISVTRAWAPLGADRFYNLVKHHFYDNASVFRAVPTFVAQFGISAYPAVTKAWKGTDIKDDPVTQSNKKGYITFATAGPDTRTTQVFINLKDNSALDRQGFAPFGVVEGDGMKVVEMFYDQYGDNAGIDQSKIETEGKAYLDKGFPKLDIIQSATLLTSAPATASKPVPPKRATTTKKPQ
jgi:cyclophilin family peptidyl-prolyl cis-trans isomerase